MCMLMKDSRQSRLSLSQLHKPVKAWEEPIRLVQELLLAKQKPSMLQGRHMWYFYSHLWPTMSGLKKDFERPTVQPDLAEIMYQDLTKELDLFRKHLQKDPPQKNSPSQNRKRPKNFPCYCATAVMHLLRSFGFSSEQLNGEASEEGEEAPEHVTKEGLEGSKCQGAPKETEEAQEQVSKESLSTADIATVSSRLQGHEDTQVAAVVAPKTETEEASVEEANKRPSTVVGSSRSEGHGDFPVQVVPIDTEEAQVQVQVRKERSNSLTLHRHEEPPIQVSAAAQQRAPAAEAEKEEDPEIGVHKQIQCQREVKETEEVGTELNTVEIIHVEPQVAAAAAITSEKQESRTAKRQKLDTEPAAIQKEVGTELNTVGTIRKHVEPHVAAAATTSEKQESRTAKRQKLDTEPAAIQKEVGTDLNTVESIRKDVESHVAAAAATTSEKQEELKRKRQNVDIEPAEIPRPAATNVIKRANHLSRMSVDDSELTDQLAPPAGLLQNLDFHLHQEKGLAWLVSREEEGNPKGGMLADDQGMGKTIQVLSLIVTRRPTGAKTLIVTPASVINQWVKEIKHKTTDAAHLEVLAYHDKRPTDPAGLRNYDVVVTSYDILRNEATDGLLGRMNWYRIVLDECQYIKNSATLACVAAWKLKAGYRWCVSGTPIQNDAKEMYSYFKFLQYTPMCDKEAFRALLKRTRRKEAKAIEELHNHIRSFTLRRMKEILPLPRKIVHDLCVDFKHDLDREIYAGLDSKCFRALQEIDSGKSRDVNSILTMLTRMRQLCVHRSLLWAKAAAKRKTDENKRKKPIETIPQKTLPEQKKVHQLVELFCQEEVAVCARCEVGVLEHSVIALCGHKYCSFCEEVVVEQGGCQFQDCNQKILKRQLFTLAELLQDNQGELLTIQEEQDYEERYFLRDVGKDEPSAKFEAVLEYLTALPDDALKSKPGAPVKEKAMLFSQWTSALNLIEPLLRKANINFRRIDGNMSLKARTKALDQFTNDDTVIVILLSLKATCTGLNIIAANHVILLEPCWNPTIEDQATDRAHRLGQVKVVIVVRLIVSKTIEESIWSLQEKKREMVRQMLYGTATESDSKTKSQKFDSLDDVRHLFNRERETGEGVGDC